jgi:hypothetical protein
MATEFITDVIDIPRLIGFIRELVDGQLPFAGMFPPRPVEDIEYELSQIDVSGAGQVARYRTWDTAPPLAKRPGFSIIGGEIPPLGRSIRLNEKDILRLQRLRAGVAAATDQQVVDVIFRDAENMANAVQNRLTLAHGDVLQTGMVTLTELGDVEAGSAVQANFNVPASHLNVVPAGAAWSDHANATPITDLKAWEAVYRPHNGGRNPDGWGVSSEIMADLAQSAQVRNLAPVTGVVPGIVTDETVRQVLRAAGVNAPLVTTNDVERQTLAETGMARVIGNRKVIAMRGGMGATLYGLTANAATMAGNGTITFTDAPGIIAFVESSIRPAAIITTAEAVALPVLLDPNALFVATV